MSTRRDFLGCMAAAAALPVIPATFEIVRKFPLGEAVTYKAPNPVWVMTSLPRDGNYAGRTVLLTTDHRLYVHDGSSWGMGLVVIPKVTA